jgi:hypothetical protein
MKTEIPHADLIRAVLDGKTVQWRQANGKTWTDYNSDPMDTISNLARDLHNYLAGYDYRIKPEPIVRMFSCCVGITHGYGNSPKIWACAMGEPQISATRVPNLKLVFEDGVLVSATATGEAS